MARYDTDGGMFRDEQPEYGYTQQEAPQPYTPPPQPTYGASNPEQPRPAAQPDVWGGYASPSDVLPWAQGASRPTGAPAGYHWDANLATFVSGAESGGGGASGMPQFGGNRFDPNYINSALQYYASQPGANQSLSSDPGYWSKRINETGGLGPDNFQYWQNLGMRPEGAPENWSPAMGYNAQNWPKPINYGGTGVFDDPATQQYEQLLNQLIGNLNTPYTPPSFGPSMDYLTKYFQQLQGPAYTDDQMGLMQTQSFDPIMQQRDAARKSITERYGAKGMAAGSGPLEAALLNSDQSFERLGTQARAGVANNAIGVQKQQQAQAAQLGPLMAGLEQQQFNSNQSRQLQAAQQASIIPQMAWNRLTGAGSAIQPLNPSALLGQQNQFQQQGYAQGSDFTNQLFQALAKIFG